MGNHIFYRTSIGDGEACGKQTILMFSPYKPAPLAPQALLLWSPQKAQTTPVLHSGLDPLGFTTIMTSSHFLAGTFTCFISQLLILLTYIISTKALKQTGGGFTLSF